MFVSRIIPPRVPRLTSYACRSSARSSTSRTRERLLEKLSSMRPRLSSMPLNRSLERPRTSCRASPRYAVINFPSFRADLLFPRAQSRAGFVLAALGKGLNYFSSQAVPSARRLQSRFSDRGSRRDFDRSNQRFRFPFFSFSTSNSTSLDQSVSVTLPATLPVEPNS